MVEQVVAPQAVVKVGDVVPHEHQQHAHEELAVLERQCEHLSELEARVGFFLILFSAHLHHALDEHQHERQHTEADDQRLIIRRALHCVGQEAGQKQNER